LAKICDLPCKYLGLPIRIDQIKREDEQLLVDKVAAKLPSWKGRLMNKAERLALVNSVLMSIVIYHVYCDLPHDSCHPFQMGNQEDRIRRNFLWTGAKDMRRGHYLVN
jgi:hypothetical protein